jgi:7-carboxy-7-deazaguanine synthase
VRIAELFQSRQGEGFLTGQESVFIRASGCNLRCWFCDTPYASWRPEGEDRSVAEIVAAVAEFACRHVVITGGEPMLFAELVELTERLKEQGKHITIETAGTRYLKVRCDLMSISPKLAGSGPRDARHAAWAIVHERRRQRNDVVRRLTRDYHYQIKFVIDVPEDLGEVERYLAELRHVDRARVLLMPQGVDAEELQRKAGWIEPYCREQKLHYCPRRQIEWFGLVRGT